MSIESTNQYDAMADCYDQLMQGGYYDYRKQASTLKEILPEGSHILEIGVGTGLMARELVAMGFSVTGMDHTKEMLDQAEGLLKGKVELLQADVLDFNLGQQFDVVLSNGGVWYGVWWDEHTMGYCGHLEKREDIEKSIENVAMHIKPGGQLVMSLQDAHRSKVMPLPDDVEYEQIIREIDSYSIEKEYIFTDKKTNERICYQKLILTYIENQLFEDAIKKFGFDGPLVSDNNRYLSFVRSGES